MTLCPQWLAICGRGWKATKQRTGIFLQTHLHRFGIIPRRSLPCSSAPRTLPLIFHFQELGLHPRERRGGGGCTKKGGIGGGKREGGGGLLVMENSFPNPPHVGSSAQLVCSIVERRLTRLVCIEKLWRHAPAVTAGTFNLGSACEKRVFGKRGLLRKVQFLEITENVEILEILETPQSVEKLGYSDPCLRNFGDFRDLRGSRDSSSETNPFVITAFFHSRWEDSGLFR